MSSCWPAATWQHLHVSCTHALSVLAMTSQQSCRTVCVCVCGEGGGELNEYKQVLADAVFTVHYGPLMYGSVPLHMLLITPLLVMDECAHKIWREVRE